MRRSRTGIFPFVFFIYICVLMVASIAAVVYVRNLLYEHEMCQPTRKVEEAIELLRQDAQAGTIWENITFPNVNVGEFEKDVNIKEQYNKLIASDNLEYDPTSVGVPENQLKYIISSDGFELAELILEKDGEAKTRLILFNIQKWKIKSVKPIITSHSYTLSVPSDFFVEINGIKLTEAYGEKDGEAGIIYKITNLYMKPEVKIYDFAGNFANYEISGKQIIPELYNFSLTLPSQLNVELNGNKHEGEELENGSIRHDIRLLTKPDVKISDNFGNKITYEGGNKIPLTTFTVYATTDYTVKVDGADVPPSAVTEERNKEYEGYYGLSELGDETLNAKIDAIPLNKIYNIAILKDNADITIKDKEGKNVSFDKKLKTLDLTKFNVYDVVRGEVASEIDLHDVARKYSLLMSDDLELSEIKDYLIVGSYQYNEANDYVSGTDITFTSPHTLKDPIFNKEVISNYTQISDDCFSVDVYLVKPMDLLSGGKYWKTVDDIMNETLYFIKYDDPNNNSDTESWKLAAMRAGGRNEQ